MTNRRYRAGRRVSPGLKKGGRVGVWGYGRDPSTPPHPHTPAQKTCARPAGARLLCRQTVLACLLAALSTTGCEEGVDPVLGTDRAFTVYGFIDARSDTQAVRVFSIEGRLELTRPERLDARVTSMDFQAGTQHAWQDSVVTFSTGRYGHVYWSGFRAAYEHRYRLELTRSDGVVTHVEVTVPPLSEPVLLPATVVPSFVYLPVLWRHAPRLNNIRVKYYTNCGVFEFRYFPDQEHVGDGTVVTVAFSNNVGVILQTVLGTECGAFDIRLEEIELLVLVTNAEWVPPTGVFDAELLVEPGTFSNVENGFGFVGAGYEASFRWLPPDSTILAAGLLVDEDEEEGEGGDGG